MKIHILDRRCQEICWLDTLECEIERQWCVCEGGGGRNVESTVADLNLKVHCFRHKEIQGAM